MTKAKQILTRFAARTAFAGLALLGSLLSTCLADDPSHHQAENLSLTPIGSFAEGPPFNTGAASIVAYDRRGQRVVVANVGAARLDILDLHNPAAPTLTAMVDLSSYGSAALCVAVHDGLIAASVQAFVKTDPGTLVLLDCQLHLLNAITVGSLPDMLTFSPNGRYVLVANEGEPNTYNDFDLAKNGPSVDPEGSVTIIDLARGPTRPVVRTATFTAFNHAPLDPSIRVYGPNATVAQDLEPEYITVSEDSRTAWVTLQENNAMAIVDIRNAVVTSLVGLGFKDHSLPGNGLDPSDKDGGINIANWPLHGIYMPDNVESFRSQGQTFLVMANEGDTRNYPGFNEEVKVATLNLDPTAFPNALELKKDSNLGRLTVSSVGADTDGDGDVDVLYSIGGRSLSIRMANGQLVWDSGDQIEQLTALLFPLNFNASHSNNTLENRSTSKGPEPEGVTIGHAYGRTLAFISLERIGGVMVYDVTNPYAPELVDYVNLRTFADPFNFATGGDLGPEGMVFINEDDSPTGRPLLVVGHEISGTVSIFQLNGGEHDED